MRDPFNASARASDGASGRGLMDGAVQRLELVVDQETAALKSRAGIDLREFNNRKSQGLLELDRALRQLDPATIDTAARARLARLGTKLEANRALLKMHLEAVREIATLVADTIRDAESDGTYSHRIGGGFRL